MEVGGHTRHALLGHTRLANMPTVTAKRVNQMISGSVIPYPIALPMPAYWAAIFCGSKNSCICSLVGYRIRFLTWPSPIGSK